MDELVFLKLGGSLITEKTQRYASRPDRLLALAREIGATLADAKQLRLVLGHGSGSFGHFAFVEHLNPSRVSAFQAMRGRGRMPTIGEAWPRFGTGLRSSIGMWSMRCTRPEFLRSPWPPSAAATATGGDISRWEIGPLRAALNSGVLPVIFGDIVFDPVLGGKVLSTEVLMWHLAQQLKPARILLAGLEEAVWADFPTRSTPIPRITPASFGAVADKIGASHGPDVTGGMKSKVEEMLALVQAVPGLTVQIFSGEKPGNLRRALAGEVLGTLITGD